MFPGVLETPLQFVFVTSLFIFLPFVAAGYYKIWKKERKLIILTDCKLSKLKWPPPKYKLPLSPNISPSNLSNVRIYAQVVSMGFYGLRKTGSRILLKEFLENMYLNF